MELAQRGTLDMECLKYKITKQGEVALFNFELDEAIEPEDLKKIKLPDPVAEKVTDKAVVISGRGPIWLYGFIIHHFHPCMAVAVFDPRLGKAVIVESHSKKYTIGETININIGG
jgi:CRISPR-associated protein Csx3